MNMIICFDQWTVFTEYSSRKDISFEEQLISKEKYMIVQIFQANAINCVCHP